MSRVVVVVSVIALWCAAIVAQTPDVPATFVIADVHAVQRMAGIAPAMTGGIVSDGRYTLLRATMLDLVQRAYRVTPSTIVGGPHWLERDRFDVIAKVPPGASQADVNMMLQGLLAERFKLVVRNLSQPMPGWVLTAGNGTHKLVAAIGKDAPGCDIRLNQDTMVAACRGVTMTDFAKELRASGGGGYLDAGPVGDLTGLEGMFDFDLKWSPIARLAMTGSPGVSLSSAIERQLGLTLERGHVPTPVLLVASVNRQPTPNAPDVARRLPPLPPPEFEVADLKRSPPGAESRPLEFQPNGRIRFLNVPLRFLINVAWRETGGQVVNIPTWAEEVRYTVVAKAPAAVGATAINWDDLERMVRALLVRRLNMKAHYENRPVAAYALIADQPKLTPADPARRTTWKRSAAPTEPYNNPRNVASVLTMQNMTMAEFAEDLMWMSGYLSAPAVDATNITGSYDFTLRYTEMPLDRGSAALRQDPDDLPGSTTASDPSGGLSFFDALKKQLGLRLIRDTRHMRVVVIDSIQEMPSDD